MRLRLAVVSLLVLASCGGPALRRDTAPATPPLPRALPSGPSPHAPAHGYRHRHAHDVRFVYDPGLEVYVVVDVPDHYYLGGSYFRVSAGQWLVGLSLDGPWQPCAHEKLPMGLQRMKKSHPGKGRR